ncbi:HAD hydrolase-like protein, partial [Salmonella enterica]|nr:HAD hydrolase-like protein [Salmonella enterica]
MKPQAIIFDLDGVITDTAHLHFMAWKQIADEMGIVIDEAFNDGLKGISRMASLRRILRHGGKEGTLSESECLYWASRK